MNMELLIDEMIVILNMRAAKFADDKNKKDNLNFHIQHVKAVLTEIEHLAPMYRVPGEDGEVIT